MTSNYIFLKTWQLKERTGQTAYLLDEYDADGDAETLISQSTKALHPSLVDVKEDKDGKPYIDGYKVKRYIDGDRLFGVA